MSLRTCTTLAALSAACLSLFALPSFGQEQYKMANPFDATEDFTATVGTGATYLKVSISKHGNVVRYESPAGSEHIRVSAFMEGYIISSGAGNTVSGWDNALGESSWGADSASGSLAAGTLKIARKTLDGKFLLTQEFRIGAANLRLILTMTLKNTSTGSLSNVWLTRMADWDVNNNPASNLYVSTPLSVLALNGVGVLTSAQASAAPSVVFQGWGTSLTAFDQTPFGSNPASLDGQARVGFPLGTLGAGASKTVKLFYQRV